MKTIEFKPNDQIYLLNRSVIDTSKIYTIISIQIQEGGNFHDGFSRETIAELKDDQNNIIYKTIAYQNQMCGIYDIYAVISIEIETETRDLMIDNIHLEF